jgi:hypothetical protein
MGNSMNSGQVSVTGSVTSVAGSPRNIIFIADTQAGAGTKDVLTVAAGTRIRILGACLSAISSAAVATSVNMYIGAGLPLIQLGIAGAGATCNATSISFEYGASPILAAGEKVQLTSAANTTTYGQLYYIVESV